MEGSEGQVDHFGLHSAGQNLVPGPQTAPRRTEEGGLAVRPGEGRSAW